MLYTFSLALAATMVLGQVDTSNYGHLAYFHSRAGTWTAEGTMGGEPVSGHVTYEWMLNNKALVAYWSLRVGSTPKNNSLEIIAWDGRDKAVKSWTFSGDGGVWSNEFAVGKQMAGIRVDGATAEGGPVTATGVSRVQGNDQWDVMAVIPAGASGVRGEYLARFTRTKTTPVDITAEACSMPQIEGLQPFIGKWKSSLVNENDERVDFEDTMEWILDGKFQLWKMYTRVDDKLTLTYMAIRGWDPAKKQVRAWGFGANGTVHRAVWTQTSNGWSLISSIADSEGKVVERRATVDTTGKTPKIQMSDGKTTQAIVLEPRE